MELHLLILGGVEMCPVDCQLLKGIVHFVISKQETLAAIVVSIDSV